VSNRVVFLCEFEGFLVGLWGHHPTTPTANATARAPRLCGGLPRRRHLRVEIPRVFGIRECVEIVLRLPTFHRPLVVATFDQAIVARAPVFEPFWREIIQVVAGAGAATTIAV